MLIVDTALRARQEASNPIKVGMIGAGAMGWGIANQIVNYMPGMTLAAVFSRTLKSARRAYAEAQVDNPAEVATLAQLEDSIRQGKPAITDNASLLCQAENIDILVEVTGTVEFAAGAVMEAIAHKKHLVMMNAELDATVGPILKAYADRAGVILSGCEGDQPGVEMNLYRFVKGLGMEPLVCGNIKGLLDPYRTPETQAKFAAEWDQNPHMVTSFADGTKIAFEQAIVANATGMGVSQRGMIGHHVKGHIDTLTTFYDPDQLREWGGIVDYVLEADPGPGVYVIGYTDDPRQRHDLEYLKKGPGPLYSFYVPYHLCSLEVPISVARVALFQDVVIAPLAGPVVDVVTTAKRDLKAGEILDGIGGYLAYGQCENADLVQAQRLLPMGLSEGCRLKRNIAKDAVITYADVNLPAGRLCDRLRSEQDVQFFDVKQLAVALSDHRP